MECYYYIPLQVATCLFDVMSGQSDIDHPLCEVSFHVYTNEFDSCSANKW